MNKTWVQAIGVIAISLGVAACGGGGSEDPPPTNNPPSNTTPSDDSTAKSKISGVAAAGAPLSGFVTIKDSLGATKTVNLATGGTYEFDVTGMTPPFVLRAEGTAGGRSYTIHSAATSADANGNINITPLTDLIIANIARQVADNYFASGNFSGLTTAQLDTAESELQLRLQGVLTELGVSDSIDLLRTSFSANHEGLDAALDVLRVTVDSATNTATIVNVLNNAKITDDLTTNDTSIIDSTGTQQYASDFDAIIARWASLEAAFANGLPATDDPLLLAQFDQTGFLDNGSTFDSFIASITSDPSNIGLRFPAVSLITLEAANEMKNGKALVTVTLTVGDGSYGYGYMNIYMTGLYDGASGKTNWIIAGNQQIADSGAEVRSTLGYNLNNPSEIESGIDFWSDVPAESPISYAIITGPGLPTSTGGVDGKSAGVLMVRNNYDNLYIAAGMYIGASTPVNPRATHYGNMYAWTDNEIKALPSDNLTYTETFYNDNGTPGIYTDDVKLNEGYQFIVLKPPFPASSLSPSNFAVVNSPSVQSILGIFNTGGTLNVTWNIPAGLAMEDFEATRFYTNGNAFDYVSGSVLPTSTGTSVVFTAPSGTVGGGMLETVAADFYNRNYSFNLFFYQ